MEKNLNQLLKWSIEAQAAAAAGQSHGPNGTSTSSSNDGPTPGAGAVATSPAPEVTAPGPRPIDPEVLASLFGGPSEADLMKAAIEVITDPSPEVTLENRLIAFDNFEQLIENLDNANLIEKLSLWSPLLSVLEHEEEEMRFFAAWCVGTAVQNNEKTQERLLAMGGVPKLVALAMKEGETEKVRRKATYALSSAVRNYQPAMDVAAEEMHKLGHEVLVGNGTTKVDAADMDKVDEVIDWLRSKAKAA
ncbi:nucleotide exchange factor Fes1-domain-containing protein [Pseudoneurospora amorphoporcata]|uniref:Nucleotide exchange factor Fes1-domain-containing protein n=1 Tax=Pseudoneurospora amorphoporcata TaxID=241081 RepID=A0AAN6NU62_9PEZI|nr:nucleotide exchange factor Fes1-domain-containing protein [Pseudoneurospora amorphoporcata]